MKKLVNVAFFNLIFGIVLMGCASIPLTSDGKSLEGVWVKEDGTTLTFSGKGWELLSIEDGVAGYGDSYKFQKNGRLELTYEIMINLKSYGVQHYIFKDKNNNDYYYMGGSPVRPFQREAIKTFRELYSDKILTLSFEDSGFNRMYVDSSTGNSVQDFVLTGDTLFLAEQLSPPDGSKSFFYNALSGTYTRVK